MTRPRLALTMGDINGIGPEILVRALGRPEIGELCRPVVVGDQRVLEAVTGDHSPALRSCAIERVSEGPSGPGEIGVLDAGIPAPPRSPGTLDAGAGHCAVEWLRAAVRLAMDGQVDAIVTCPINKEGIKLAGCTATGHTEIIAEMTNSPDYRMCLFADRLRIVHISSHFPLARAIQMVKTQRIVTSIRIADQALARLALPRRRIAVAGLNPHAGEAGLLGDEEAREIAPAIQQCREDHIDCSGPYPPDTVFRRMAEGEFELVVAMYHDQGHIPLKLIAMDEGVNVTLGIPIVRTSVDHGTAYDIAGKGLARDNSLCAAIRLAADFVGKRS